MSQVGEEAGPGGEVHTRGYPGQELGDLGSAGGVAGPVALLPLLLALGAQSQHLLAPQLPQVSHSQLQHVSLLQLGDALPLSLQGEHHQVLQLVQTFVDPRSPLSLQHWLHHFPVLVGPGHRSLRHLALHIKVVHGSCRQLRGVRALTSSTASPGLAASPQSHLLECPGAARGTAGRQKLKPWERFELAISQTFNVLPSCPLPAPGLGGEGASKGRGEG